MYFSCEGGATPFASQSRTEAAQIRCRKTKEIKPHVQEPSNVLTKNELSDPAAVEAEDAAGCSEGRGYPGCRWSLGALKDSDNIVRGAA